MTGIALVELYDLDTAAMSQLANISTRGTMLGGDNVMIGGFIISGASSANVLVRAIGPELSANHVTGALQDTVLELYNGSGTQIGTNDDWKPGRNRRSSTQRSRRPMTANRQLLETSPPDIIQRSCAERAR
jgi:hypothetical protein